MNLELPTSPVLPFRNSPPVRVSQPAQPYYLEDYVKKPSIFLQFIKSVIKLILIIIFIFGCTVGSLYVIRERLIERGNIIRVDFKK